MAIISIWGNTTPAGTWQVATDGDPSIEVGNGFYPIAGSRLLGKVCTGGKVWVPAGQAGKTIRINARLSITPFSEVTQGLQLSAPPIRTEDAVIANNAAHWEIVNWDTPFLIPETPTLLGISHSFVSHPTHYIAGAGARASNTFVPSMVDADAKIYWSESFLDWNVLQYAGTFYRLGTGPTVTSPGLTSYGGDFLIDDAATTIDPPVDPPVEEPVSSIAQENARPGHGQQFWLDGITSEAIPAFARSTYYESGQTAYISADCSRAFEAEIYRLGSYGGAGGRRVQEAFAATPATQPAPVAIPGGNGAVTCAAWSQNVSWQIPADATPGWYEVLLRSNDRTLYGYALFCVTDKLAKKPLLMVTGDATWHAAYNGYGGNNVYGNEKGVAASNAGRALCSTYDKPVITKDYVPQTHFFNNSYPVLKFLEQMGYEVGQTTIEQIKNDPSILDGRELIMWTGHNEYIPQNVMTKTKQLLAAGQNMINIAGNDFFWRVKFTDGAFDSNANGRVMWCKKDTMSGPTAGPNAVPSHVGGQPFTTAAAWTGTWQDTRWNLREPSEEFFGDRFVANGIRADSVSVPAAMKSSPAWRNCAAIQSLAAGASYSFAPGTLGMEWDKPVSVPGGPAQVSFSSTTINLAGNAADINGENYNTSEIATHAFTMGVNSAGALIANFNSDQWGWALDALHLRGSAPANPAARQMMLNVISDLGVQPNAAAVSAAALVTPVPVTNPSVAYGITTTPVDPEPVNPPPPSGLWIKADDGNWYGPY